MAASGKTMPNIRNPLSKALLLSSRVTVWSAIGMICAAWGASAIASEAAPAGANGAYDEDLDEVLVDGRRPLRDPRVALDWLQRLVGQFTVQGKVHLHGRSQTDLPVQGHSVCLGLGSAPSVLCELNISWPEVQGSNGDVIAGVTPNLSPAILLFGFEPTRAGIHHMFVGNDGIADGTLGYLLSEDMLVARAECGGVKGACERVVRFMARPEGKSVRVEIDVEIERRRAVTIAFEMHRVPRSLSDTVPGR